MKARLRNLITIYEGLAAKMRHGGARDLLENIIEDLKSVLKEAQ